MPDSSRSRSREARAQLEHDIVQIVAGYAPNQYAKMMPALRGALEAFFTQSETTRGSDASLNAAIADLRAFVAVACGTTGSASEHALVNAKQAEDRIRRIAESASGEETNQFYRDKWCETTKAFDCQTLGHCNDHGCLRRPHEKT